MQRCLQLAAMGAGLTAPNPMVGAVLMHQGRIIGEGYHQKYGEAHAEVNCINSVEEKDKELIPESTIYVSLEPCAHFGKTPPCADLIIKNKIPHVVIGCRDSYEAVDGKGIERLKAAGVKVIVGVLEEECRELNKRFFTFHEKQRPYIILKWAQSSNGKIGGVNSSNYKVSNEFADRLVHQWRTEESAILVGTNTAKLDDPALTARLWPGKNPLRLVIDLEFKLPAHLKLFDGSTKSIVFSYHKQASTENLVYHQLSKTEGVLAQILSVLHAMQVQSVIVEGGSKTLQSFIDAGLWDEARVITNSDLMIEEGLDAPILKNDQLTETRKIESDIIQFSKHA